MTALIQNVTIEPSFDPGYVTKVTVEISGSADEQANTLASILRSAAFVQSYVDVSRVGVAFAEAIQDKLDQLAEEYPDEFPGEEDYWYHVVPFSPNTVEHQNRQARRRHRGHRG